MADMIDNPDTLPPCPFCGAQLVPLSYLKAGSARAALMHPIEWPCLLAGTSWPDSALYRARWSRRVSA